MRYRQKRKPLDFICLYHCSWFFAWKRKNLSSNGSLAVCLCGCISVCVCPSLCVISAWAYWVPVTTMGKSDWIQQWLHSLWPRLQAPGGWETVNKPQLAASPGVTQQPGCLFFSSFSKRHEVRIVKGLTLRTGLERERSWMGLSVGCVCFCVIMYDDWPPGGCASGAVVPGGPWQPLPQSPSAPLASGLCSAPGCLWSSPSSVGVAGMQPDLRVQK